MLQEVGSAVGLLVLINRASVDEHANASSLAKSRLSCDCEAIFKAGYFGIRSSEQIRGELVVGIQRRVVATGLGPNRLGLKLNMLKIILQASIEFLTRTIP